MGRRRVDLLMRLYKWCNAGQWRFLRLRGQRRRVKVSGAIPVSGDIYGFEANVGGSRNFMRQGEIEGSINWERLSAGKEDGKFIVPRAMRLTQNLQARRLRKVIIEDIRNGLAGIHFRT